MSKQRYLKITQTDGARYILRVTKESPRFVHGYEVNAEGDEVVPAGYERRHRTIERTSIAKAVEMRMNPKYAALEIAPKKPSAQLDAEIAAALAKAKEST